MKLSARSCMLLVKARLSFATLKSFRRVAGASGYFLSRRKGMKRLLAITLSLASIGFVASSAEAKTDNSFARTANARPPQIVISIGSGNRRYRRYNRGSNRYYNRGYYRRAYNRGYYTRSYSRSYYPTYGRSYYRSYSYYPTYNRGYYRSYNRGYNGYYRRGGYNSAVRRAYRRGFIRGYTRGVNRSYPRRYSRGYVIY